MVRFNKMSETGNIFWILGQASRELKQSEREEDANVMLDRVTRSGSYEEALKIIGEYVELEESDE